MSVNPFKHGPRSEWKHWGRKFFWTESEANYWCSVCEKYGWEKPERVIEE